MRPVYLFLFLLCFLFWGGDAGAQLIDLREDRAQLEGSSGSGLLIENPFEWLHEGRFGFNADLGTQATLQVLRYRIGEQDGFSLPLYILSTANGPGFGDLPPEQLTFNAMVTPTGGLLNSFLAEDLQLIGKSDRSTALSLAGTLGYKLLPARKLAADSSATVSTLYSDAGIRLATGAWISGAGDKQGTFAIQAKVFATSALGERGELGAIFGDPDRSWFVGLSADVVLYIADAIDFRLNWSRALSEELILPDQVQRSVVTLALNYGVQ
jgi:hypothetical protein